MSEIINRLKPFIKDNYRRINVREYARIQKISPPTASKLLFQFKKEGLLKQEAEKQYIYYYANKNSDVFIDISRIYWKMELENSGLLDYIENETVTPVIVLFGSLAKAEARSDSDIDLAVFTASKKELDLSKYEKILKRKIQVMIFRSKDGIESKELLNNILNGYKIRGCW